MSTRPRRVISVQLMPLLALALITSAQFGCGSEASSSEIRSDKPRDESPEVDASTVQQLASAQSRLALDLYDKVRQDKPDANLFLSPLSIHQCLNMVHAGAQGETRQQMTDTLHVGELGEALHPANNKLDLSLAKEKDFTLRLANGVWVQDGGEWNEAFLDTLAVNYGAGLRSVDFKNNPDGAREAVNEWVSQQTKGKIPSLLSSQDTNDDTRFVLANAIYFDARWDNEFKEHDTWDGTFHKLDGSSVEVPMLHDTRRLPYHRAEDGTQVVSLDYRGNSVEFVAVVPERGKLGALEKKLSAAWLEKQLEARQRRRVSLALPKFEFRSRFSLAAQLKSLGMPLAFDPERADLTGMGEPDYNFFLQAVVHEAYVRVDERGTEAAAATAAAGAETAEPPSDMVRLHIDRPFLFLIRHNETGAWLFLGRVTDPQAAGG